MKHPRLLAALSLFLVGSAAVRALDSAPAPFPVPVGKGSYASSPPPDVDHGKPAQMNDRRLYLVDPGARPIPTNKWWTQLVVAPFAKELWAYPLRVDPSPRGLAIYYPQKWRADGNDPQCDFPLGVEGIDFQATDSRAKAWSDWLVSFRLGESADKYMDVTLGEGMPYVWIEPRGVRLVLRLPPNAGADAGFFNRAGKSVPLPVTGDCLGIAYAGRHYGVFAPDGTKFEIAPNSDAFTKAPGAAVAVTFAGKASFLVVCPLPTAVDLEPFHAYAYAIPRDTRLSWHYDPVNALVTTDWKITTEPLKPGANPQVIQGWLPHHYLGTEKSMPFNRLAYLTPRGELRCAVGNEFSIAYPYTGIVPNLPAPQKVEAPNPYDPARMRAYLAQIAAKPSFGADTYWGGKDVLRFGQGALMAQQTRDDSYRAFCDGLRGALENWFTYTPGEKDHFFTAYPRWGAIVGMSPSYGSGEFNDQHFHYGYFTFAAALMAAQDRQFAADYGPMAKLVAKEYANWDRDDTRFPFFRTFDIWAGHSWAGGTGSAGGENQESSSEAVQGWAGLIYLGQALGDRDMVAAGVMGYAMETRAAMEYWFNASGASFPPEWKHPVTGMVWSGGKVYGTYFTGDPAWIYGIQWLPASPMLSYLVRDPAFARKSYENMLADVMAKKHGRHSAASAGPASPPTIKSFGDALGSVMLGYVLMYDPAWACAQLDALWDEPGDRIAHNASQMAIMYYMAHSMRSLGRVDWTCHATSATSMVYINDATHTRTCVVWNPLPAAQTVEVYQEPGHRLLGKVDASPQSLTSAALPVSEN